MILKFYASIILKSIDAKKPRKLHELKKFRPNKLNFKKQLQFITNYLILLQSYNVINIVIIVALIMVSNILLTI